MTSPSGLGGTGGAPFEREELDDASEDAALVAALSQGGGDGDEPFVPFCASVEEWVTVVFAPTYNRRATASFRWCAQWWRHAEAISRLEALWRSWEALRLEPMRGLATWYRDHLDSQLTVLTAPEGPFANCTPDAHYDPQPARLPVVPAPDGWWPQPAAS